MLSAHAGGKKNRTSRHFAVQVATVPARIDDAQNLVELPQFIRNFIPCTPCRNVGREFDICALESLIQIQCRRSHLANGCNVNSRQVRLRGRGKYY